MRTFKRCPNSDCERTHKGNDVRKCLDCGHIGCKDNVSVVHKEHCWYRYECLECGSDNWENIGTIWTS